MDKAKWCKKCMHSCLDRATVCPNYFGNKPCGSTEFTQDLRESIGRCNENFIVPNFTPYSVPQILNDLSWCISCTALRYKPTCKKCGGTKFVSFSVV